MFDQVVILKGEIKCLSLLALEEVWKLDAMSSASAFKRFRCAALRFV